MKDSDDDGYGDGSVIGDVTAGSDCDDGDANILPTAEEVCGDGVDNTCDTAIDAYYTSNQPPTIDGALSVANADGGVPLFSDDLIASNVVSSDVEDDDVLLQYDWRQEGDSFATYNANFDVDELCSVSEKSTWNHIGTKIWQCYFFRWLSWKSTRI